MNTGHLCHLTSLIVVRLVVGERIDTEEVDGSSPFGPTIYFNYLTNQFKPPLRFSTCGSYPCHE